MARLVKLVTTGTIVELASNVDTSAYFSRKRADQIRCLAWYHRSGRPEQY